MAANKGGDPWYREKVSPLYQRLGAEQFAIDSASAGIEAGKPVTRIDLACRADRAQQSILSSFHDRG